MEMLLLTTILISVICHSNVLTSHVPRIYQVSDPIDHGEGPIWDPRSNLLYFVNTYEGGVLSYNYFTSQVNAIYFSGNTTPIVPTKASSDLLVVGVERSLFAIKWKGVGPVLDEKHLVTLAEQFPTSRNNEGKADKRGRLLIGTLGAELSTGIAPNEGILYSITKDTLNNPLPIIQPVNISNGMAWNKANNKFYYIDTGTLMVKQFDYDIHNGSISNPKVVFDVTKHENISGYPDGMTIDKDDNLWVALMHGGVVVNVNPNTGNILKVIKVPAQRVTSVAWGGPKLDVLYITTSKHNISPTEIIEQPASGSLFAATNLGTCGLPIFYTNIVTKI